MNKLAFFENKDKFRSIIRLFIIISSCVDICSTLYQTSISLCINFLLLGVILKYYYDFNKTTLKLIIFGKALSLLTETARFLIISSIINNKTGEADFYKDKMLSLFSFQFIIFFIQLAVNLVALLISLIYYKKAFKTYDCLLNNKYFELIEAKAIN